jgi:hypothetical protein
MPKSEPKCSPILLLYNLLKNELNEFIFHNSFRSMLCKTKKCRKKHIVGSTGALLADDISQLIIRPEPRATYHVQPCGRK